MKLRIYADFNSCDADWCWLLRYDGRILDDVAADLRLVEGQPVVLFYADSSEEFEFDAVLSYRNGRWQALPDQTTYRLIRSQGLRDSGFQ